MHLSVKNRADAIDSPAIAGVGVPLARLMFYKFSLSIVILILRRPSKELPKVSCVPLRLRYITTSSSKA
jgi:hypothetical protein